MCPQIWLWTFVSDILDRVEQKDVFVFVSGIVSF